MFRSVDRGSSPAQIDLTFTFRFTPTEMIAVRVCVCARLEHMLPLLCGSFKRYNRYIRCFARVPISTAFFTAVSSPPAWLSA